MKAKSSSRKIATPKKPSVKKRKSVKPRPAPNRRVEFERYAFFLAFGKKDRTEIFGYHTDIKFAEDYGVNKDTLVEWKSRPELWDERDKHLIHLRKYTADILENVAQRAIKTGDSFHAINFMKLVEGYTEKTGLDLTSKGKKVEGFKFVVVKPQSKSPLGESVSQSNKYGDTQSTS